MTTRSKGDWRRWIARLVQIVPGAGFVLHRGVRLIQPRFNMGVVGVVLDETGEHVLVVEHVFHPDYPWGLPGGWINRGEDPAQTVVRELGEEVSLAVRAVRPLMVERSVHHRGLMDVVYLCALDGPDQTVRLSYELLDYRWLSLDNLDDLPLMAFHRAAIQLAHTDHRGTK